MSFLSAPETATKTLPAPDRVGLAIVLMATLMLVIAVMRSASLQSANDRSRWCTVWSLVERGTFQIDEIDRVDRWSTIDKVRHREDDEGPYHFYSSKPPLLSTMVAGLYWIERNTLGYSLDQDTDFVSRMLLLLVNVFPMFLALLSLRKSLQLLGVNRMALWMLMSTAGFASMLNPFLTTLNNHTPAAITLIFCLSAMARVTMSSRPRGRDFAVIGFMAALTCCFELPAALLGILSFFFVLKRDWRKTVKWFVPAAIIPLAAFFITNAMCTGGIKPFYAYYGTDKYVYVHEGVPSYWTDPQGIDANTESPAIYLMHCIVGHHGILSLSPVFLLTLAGWYLIFWRRTEAKIFTIQCMGCGLTLAVLSFYLTRTENYNYGGNSAALRWMLWLTPFWWYGMIPAVQKLTSSAKGTVVMLLLLAASVYSSVYSLNQPWKPGWIYERMERAGWVDYRRRIPPFNPSRYSLITQLPDIAGVTGEWVQTIGTRRILKIVAQPAAVLNGADVFPLQMQLMSADDDVTEAIELEVLSESFRRGEDITLWLKTLNAETLTNAAAGDVSARRNIDETMLQTPPKWVVDTLRGLPASRMFNSASPRYLKYTRADGEKTAVKCQRGAARVVFEHPDHGRCWQRCDVLFCDELPFGVAQWRITVTSDATRQILHSELWTCRYLP